MQPELQVQGTWIILFGILTLIGIGWWLYSLTKKYPKMKLGAIITMIMVEHNETVFIMLSILIGVAEATMAASIHPVGQAPPNPFARFMTHFATQLAAMGAGLVLFRDIAQIFRKGGWTILTRLLTAAAVGLLALGLPVANMYIISNGLRETAALQLFWASWNPFISDAAYDAAVLSQGFTLPYSSWDGLSYVMCATCMLTLTGLVVIFIEGLRCLDPDNAIRYRKMFEKVTEDDGKDEKDEKGDKGDKKKKPEGEDTEEVKKVTDNLRYLLLRFGYHGEDLRKMVANSASKVDTIQGKLKAKFATRISNLVIKCEDFDLQKEAFAEKERNTKNALIDAEIRTLFESSPKEENMDKRGFGIKLRKKS